MSWGVGTVIVAVVLAVLAATYFLFQSFVSSDESGKSLFRLRLLTEPLV
jgi:hypothetical protein